MRAIRALTPGGPEVMSADELPDPSPGAGQVVVRLATAGVNFIDTYRREGRYPMPFPHVVGSEGAGVVVATGPDVADIAEGDRVAWCDGSTGSYAELVVLDAARAVPVPDAVALDLAAALMLQGLTAHYLATSTAPVGPGQAVVVHAGAGGVGLLLTQLAAARGETVLTTVSTEQKEALSRGAGATEVLRYDLVDDLTSELPQWVRAHSGGQGAHTVFDGVGASTFDASLASLRPRGMLVLFGGASGPVPPFDLMRLSTGGSLFVTRPTLGHYVATTAELRDRAAELFAMVTAGSLDVRVGARFALADAADAHRALQGRATTGKVLLEP